MGVEEEDEVRERGNVGTWKKMSEKRGKRYRREGKKKKIIIRKGKYKEDDEEGHGNGAEVRPTDRQTERVKAPARGYFASTGPGSANASVI